MQNTLKVMISTSIFQEGQKKMREKTSVEVSGVYFGHMKAYVQSLNLSNFEATMSHIPFITSYSLQDQKVAVNTITEKKGKDNLVRDLRRINQIEADFNFNNKVIDRLIMNYKEENGLLPTEQYGSRKSYRVSHQAINKRLVYNLTHLQHQLIVLCSNNAKLYYDCIVHSITSLAMQRLSMLAVPIVSIFKTIQQIDYLIRIVYRDSESKLRSSKESIPNQSIL